MNLAQVSLLLSAHGQVETETARDRLILARAAQASSDGFKGVLAALEKTIN